MANDTLRGGCPAPFYQDLFFGDGGYTEGRLCQRVGEITCCFPCPMSDWAYPERFNTLGVAAEWVAVASTACCIFLLSSWACLPVEKTSRHYLSISLATAILLMNLGFVVPLVGQPDQCFDAITPHSMNTNNVCAASGTLLLLGGWSAVLWVFLRSLSLHLQICWQLVAGRNFMWISQAVGWGIPVLGIIVALVFSGVSFRFGATCHINHKNSLADLWIPLLVFAGLTIIIQFSTFGYCIKVYLASLADNNESTDKTELPSHTGLPSYTTSIRTMTPKQAYRRVRRVIQLQWRGIAIVLIIITDVIFFSVVFVFQDNIYEQARHEPNVAHDWVLCLAANADTPDNCLDRASHLVANLPTVGAVLILLAMNGFWLICLLGRWSMFLGWYDLCFSGRRAPKEFVSVDARIDDFKKEPRSYEMLSAGNNSVTRPAVRPLSPAVISPGSVPTPSTPDGAPKAPDGWQTPDYFGTSPSRYHAPARSFSRPRPPQHVTWRAVESLTAPMPEEDCYVNPLMMNKI